MPKPDDDPYNRCNSPLMRIQWERVMLDEGHVIRNPKTHGALSACRLVAKHRWIVTGKPCDKLCFLIKDPKCQVSHLTDLKFQELQSITVQKTFIHL